MTAALSLGRAEIDALRTRMPAQFTAFRANTTKLVSAANSVLGTLPAPLATQVTQLLDRFVAVTDDVIAKVEPLMAETGDPFALWSAGSDWVQRVGNVVAGQRTALGSPAELLDDWTGGAALRYQGVLTEQRDALSAIKKITDPLQDALTAVANAIIALWVALAAALVASLLDLLGAVAAIIGGVTAPAGILLGIKVALQLAGAAAAGASAVATFLSTEKAQLAKLQQLQGIEGFRPDPNNPTTRHWPTPTQPLKGKQW
jgi:hypothetical protein